MNCNSKFISDSNREYIINKNKYYISKNIKINSTTKIFYNQDVIDKLYKHIKFFVENILNKFIKYDYWAIGGTLLGIIRHKGLVVWDSDADFAITLNGYNIILREIKKINKIMNIYDKNYEFAEYFNGYKLYYGQDCIIDLFVVDYLPGNKNKLVYSGYIDNYGKSTFLQYKIIFPFIYFLKNEIFPLKKKYCCDFQINIPNNYEKILYNNYSENCLKQIIQPGINHINLHNSFLNKKKSIHVFIKYKEYRKKYLNVINLIDYFTMLFFYNSFSNYQDKNSKKFINYKIKLSNHYNTIDFKSTFIEIFYYIKNEHKFILRLINDYTQEYKIINYLSTILFIIFVILLYIIKNMFQYIPLRMYLL